VTGRRFFWDKQNECSDIQGNFAGRFFDRTRMNILVLYRWQVTAAIHDNEE